MFDFTAELLLLQDLQVLEKAFNEPRIVVNEEREEWHSFDSLVQIVQDKLIVLRAFTTLIFSDRQICLQELLGPDCRDLLANFLSERLS